MSDNRKLALIILAGFIPFTANSQSNDIEYPVQLQLGYIDKSAIDLKPAGAFSNLEQEEDDFPWVGVNVQGKLGGYKGVVEYGLDTGGFVNFDLDIDSAWVDENGARVRMSSNYFFFEFYAGPYVALNIADRLRLHLTTGPSLLLGNIDAEAPNVEQLPVTTVNIDYPDDDYSDFDASVGWQGKVGADFRINQSLGLGASVRYLRGDLQFKETIGEVSLDGVQYFLTFTYYPSGF